MRCLPVLFMVFLFLSANVSAFSLSGLFDYLMSFFGGSREEFVCSKPYLQVGLACCLDINNNGICDSDEDIVVGNPPPNPPVEYCGDGSCQDYESCKSCQSDCGPCGEEEYESCTADDDCSSGYCVHSICRDGGTFCGDGACDRGETPASCPSDCKKVVGVSESALAMCESNGIWYVLSKDKITKYDPSSGGLLSELSVRFPHSSIVCLENGNILAGYYDETKRYGIFELDGEWNIVDEILESDLGCVPHLGLYYGRNWFVKCVDEDADKVMLVDRKSKEAVTDVRAGEVLDIYSTGEQIGYLGSKKLFYMDERTNHFKPLITFDEVEEYAGKVLPLSNGDMLVWRNHRLSEVNPETGETLWSDDNLDLADYTELGNGDLVFLGGDFGDRAVQTKPIILG
ncbi:MAG: hypothetical protein GF416_08800 [Candidatus Altiarchaeales archaeon]|nr:hypothetical protein [Candidatus Altiarchaeales archaeon]MBD3417215.1 hypothetical protein [Candidatus Altiarchaeales archaeon]